MTAISAYSANRMTPALTSAYAAPTIDPGTQRAGSPASRSLTGFDPAPAGSRDAVNGMVSAQFGSATATDFASAAGGGVITDALESGVARIAAFAQRGITGIQRAIQGDMNANNGQMDPAKMQQYTMQMSNFEMMMQMAAKIQEKQEAAARVWLR